MYKIWCYGGLEKKRKTIPYINIDVTLECVEFDSPCVSQRGKFRPRLKQLVGSNSEEVVLQCTKKAFCLLPDVQSAIAELSTLKGLGPATASGKCTRVEYMTE